ncbi:MAG: MerR family transcriptional regulator [Betaproteobacteria bacterium]|nr:MerR family transcriptional regulator [Betaproteobacteria bacterium]
MLSIGAVERDTGLSKDVLRMWERRYRYPTPLRDEHGERVYPPEQVTKLRAIKRLMDRGFRPGKIIGLPIDELSALGTSHASSEQRDAGIVEVIELIRAHRLPDFRQRLQQMLMRQGLQRFVMDTVAPLTVAVGEAWVRGEFAVFEEHLYTEQVQGVLRNAIASAQGQGRSPRVLLTSFPTEQHNLGLLMVEALLVVEGVICIPLGTETPAVEIVRAADAHRANAVALSFSAAFPDRQASSGLRELRALLPRGIEIWAGGSCVRRLRRGIDGVQVVKSLDQVSQLVGAWRSSHGMP